MVILTEESNLDIQHFITCLGVEATYWKFNNLEIGREIGDKQIHFFYFKPWYTFCKCQSCECVEAENVQVDHGVYLYRFLIISQQYIMSPNR